MGDIVQARFIYPSASFADAEELFTAIGADLEEAGMVRPTFAAALTRREATYPTGLPVSDGVAIPHTDAEHVICDTIAVATLATPMSFRPMGGVEDGTLQVSTVFVLALSNPDEHVDILPRIVRSIQRPEFLASLRGTTDTEEIAALVNHAFGPTGEPSSNGEQA